MHDVACEFARADVRSKDAQKQSARTSLSVARFSTFNYKDAELVFAVRSSVKNHALISLAPFSWDFPMLRVTHTLSHLHEDLDLAPRSNAIIQGCTTHELSPIQPIRLKWSSAFDPIKFDWFYLEQLRRSSRLACHE